MIPLAIILVYLALLLGLGLFSNRLFRGTEADYALASHSIGPFLLLMSLFGTTMTAFALVGSTGEAYILGVGVYGMLASASGIVHSLCFFLVGVKLWSWGRKFGYTTQIEFFRDRLESEALALVLFPILVGLIIPYLLVGVISAGDVVQTVTKGAFLPADQVAAVAAQGDAPAENAADAPEAKEEETAPATSKQSILEKAEYGVPSQIASLVICLVVLIYVFAGGMRGTAWANTMQTMVFMVLGVVTFFVIAKGLGGTDSLIGNLRAAIADVDNDHLSRSKIPMPVYFSFVFVPLSVAMFPHVFQHWLTARSAASFKLPVVAHPIFIMIVWVPCVLIGVWASGLPEQMTPNEVLGTLVQQFAGPMLGGLLTAGILAAIMSSLDSQFLCIGTIFTHDILMRYARPVLMKDGKVSEGRKVLAARLFVIAVVAVTYLFSLYPNESVFRLGIWCFSGFTGLFPLVIAALYWKRLTEGGALASVITMAASWLWLFARADYGKVRMSFPDKEFNEQLPQALQAVFAKIPGMMPVVTITLLAALSLVLVSLVTPRPSQATLDKFFPDRDNS